MPKNLQELAFLTEKSKQLGNNIWLGFYRENFTCASPNWINKSPYIYTKFQYFCPNQPDCYQNNEACSELWNAGCTNDIKCSELRNYVCEYIASNVRTLNSHTRRVRAFTLLQNGDLISGSEDATIKIWNPIDGTLKKTLSAHLNSTWALITLNNSGNFVSASDDTTIKIWTSEGELLKTLDGHLDGVRSLVLLKNDDFASGSRNGTIKIWSANGELKKVLTGHTDIVNRMVLLQNGDLASASYDSLVKIWAIDSGQLKRNLTGHVGRVNALAVLKNGDLASGSDDRKVKIWSESGDLKNTFALNTTAVYAIAVLSNGDFAIGSGPGITIVDNNGQVKQLITDHGNYVWTMILMPNGDLASSTNDNTIKVSSL